MSDRQAPYKTDDEHFDSIRSNVVLRWLGSLAGERVVLAFLALIAGVGVVELGAVPDLLSATGTSLVDTAPFIAASVLIAASIKASGADQLIGRALGGRTAIAVVTASIFGALSPFCSCGVVPLIAALLAAGVPLAPVMAFWLASPVIDPEMMVLSWGVLGAELTLAKTLSAIALGLAGGAVVMAVQRGGGYGDVLKGAARGCSTGCGPTSAIDPNAKPVWTFWREGIRRQLFSHELRTSGWFLAKWLTLAFLLEAMMLRWVPMDQVAGGLRDLGLWSVPAAALSFMVAGGITSIPAAVAVHALVRWPVFLTYLGLAAVGSVGVGLAYAVWLGL